MPQDRSTPAAPLGVGALVSEVFRLFRTRFQEVFLLSLLYSVVSLAASVALIGPERTFGPAGDGTLPAPETGGDGLGPGALPVAQMELGDVVNSLAQLFLSALFIAVVARLVVDHAEGRRAGAGTVLRQGLRSAPSVAGLSLVIGLAVGLGLALLVVPGLWAFAVFAVAIPVAAVEGAGLGALGRSAALTRGYRWPIVGFGLVFFGIVLALSIALGLFVLAPLGIVMLGSSPGPVGGALLAIVSALVGAAYAGLGALPAPVLYLRLRALKETGG